MPDDTCKQFYDCGTCGQGFNININVGEKGTTTTTTTNDTTNDTTSNNNNNNGSTTTTNRNCEECENPSAPRSLPGFRAPRLKKRKGIGGPRNKADEIEVEDGCGELGPKPKPKASRKDPVISRCRELLAKEDENGFLVGVPPFRPVIPKEPIFENIGFPIQLGEPTFEEMKEENTPSPWLTGVPCKEQTEEDDELEEIEATLPGDVGGVVPPTPPPSPPVPDVFGCTDPIATNYNPSATVDDGSCVYAPPVAGCTDPTATNYNPAATVDDGSCVFGPALPTGMTPEYTIIAPNAPTMMDDATSISQAVPSVTSQDPDGIGWLNWSGTQWDGTPFDTTGKTKSQICSFLRPTGGPYNIRGIREKFYAVNPFADNLNPTPEEIDNWNIEVIRHFRAMLGVSTPVNNDPRLYLEARWADERKYTEAWDSSYPSGTPGGPSGPCWNPPGTPVDIAAGHCGASFFPNPADRATYIAEAPYSNDFAKYPELDPGVYTSRRGQAEGLNAADADLPWSIKLSVMLTHWICNEGLTGHPGPYVNPSTARQWFGCSWWLNGTVLNFRGKWR